MTSLRSSTIGAVAAGGALGTGARDALARAFTVTPGHFPVTILVVNLLGALALGLAHSALLPGRDRLRPFVAVGFLGSFTTFGSVMVAAVDLGRLGSGATGWTYLAATIGGGLAAAWTGLRGGAALVGSQVAPR